MNKKSAVKTGRHIFSILARSFWILVRDIVQVARIFWPAFLLAAAFAAFYWNAHKFEFLNEELAIAGIALLFIYLLMILISSLVQWHRKIVLSSIDRARFIPKMREWRYFGHFLLFGLVSYLYYTLMLRVAEHVKIAPFIDESREFFAFVLSCLLFAFLFKRFLLILPRLSVEEEGFVVSSGVLIDATKGFKWPLTIFLMLVITGMIPDLMSLLFFLEVSFDRSTSALELTTAMIPALSVWIALGAYCALVFATLLSLFYQHRVRPQWLTIGSRSTEQYF